MDFADAPLDAFGWLADRTGCGYIRLQLSLTVLRSSGLRTGWSERLDPEHLPRTLIGQRVTMPGPTWRWQEIVARRQRPKLVYEIDDNLFELDPSNSTYGFFNSSDAQQNMRANLRAADLVTVTTEPLAEVVRSHNPDVHVIPNYLPAWLLEHERPRREGKVVIGWGGSATHTMDWEVCGPHVRRYLNRAPDHVQVHVMGADYTHQAKLPQGRVRVTPWIQTAPEYWRSIDYDIMLAPLHPHPFNASKSNLRVLEAAFLGIPAVASDYGPYAEFVQHGVTGLLAKGDHDWGRHLRALVEDPQMRAELGANARRQAGAWTIEGHADEWRKAIA